MKKNNEQKILRPEKNKKKNKNYLKKNPFKKTENLYLKKTIPFDKKTHQSSGKSNPLFFFKKNSLQKFKPLRLKRPKHFQKKKQAPGEKKQEKWTPLKKTKTLGKKNSTDKNQIKPLGNKNRYFLVKKNSPPKETKHQKKTNLTKKNLQKKQNPLQKKPQLLAQKNLHRKHAKEKQKKKTFEMILAHLQKNLLHCKKKNLTKETATSLKKKKSKQKPFFQKKKKSTKHQKNFETIPLFLLCSVVASEKNFSKKKNLKKTKKKTL